MPPPSPPLTKRSYTLRLTFSALITAIIVLIIAVGWSFMLGVMVERGHNPEKIIPQLATLLPSEEGAQTTREQVGDTLPKGEVMKAEDLRYANTLKAKPGQTAPTPPKPKNMQNATAQVSTPPATHPLVATAPAHASAIPAQARAPQEQEPVFDAVFQVATFKDTDAVDRLRARLEGQGIRARMDKDGKLFKVMVLVRGNNARVQEVEQLMVDMNLGKPLLRGKTPVARR